jgi:hypothetical protein
MERHFEYPAWIEQRAAGFYLITAPDFPEAATDGRSLSEALGEATDCHRSRPEYNLRCRRVLESG